MAPCVTSTPSARRAEAWRLAPLGPLCLLSRQAEQTSSFQAHLGLIPPLELITRCQGTLPSWYVGGFLLSSVESEGRCLRTTPTCLR